MPTFPSSIRPPLIDGYTETAASTNVSSQSDIGSGKTRVRSSAIKSEISLTYQMTDAEWSLFFDFYNNDIGKGALRFDWVDPMTGSTEKVKIVGAYNKAPRGRVGLYRVSFQIKVLR